MAIFPEKAGHVRNTPPDAIILVHLSNSSHCFLSHCCVIRTLGRAGESSSTVTKVSQRHQHCFSRVSVAVVWFVNQIKSTVFDHRHQSREPDYNKPAVDLCQCLHSKLTIFQLLSAYLLEFGACSSMMCTS